MKSTQKGGGEGGGSYLIAHLILKGQHEAFILTLEVPTPDLKVLQVFSHPEFPVS